MSQRSLQILALSFFMLPAFSWAQAQNGAAIKKNSEVSTSSKSTEQGGTAVSQPANSAPATQITPAPSEIRATDVPSDYPVYINTGNPANDKQAYDIAKRQWIENNPAKYQEMNPAQSGKQVLKRADFNALPESRRQYIIQNPERFEIID